MKKRRILLVDDEVSFTRLLKMNLEQMERYEVRIENRAAKALNTAREFRPDLVLLDVVMPQMVGSEVAEGLRADSAFASTPIIFFSAVGGRKSPHEHNHRLDGYPYISKPASVEEVVEHIERHLPGASADGPHQSIAVPRSLCATRACEILASATTGRSPNQTTMR
jgi:DNA-binding response OmpR family regulator